MTPITAYQRKVNTPIPYCGSWLSVKVFGKALRYLNLSSLEILAPNTSRDWFSHEAHEVKAAIKQL